jgi:hypothetical protein
MSIRHIALTLLMVAGPSLADDDGYGEWEIITEMKASGPGGNSSFSNTEKQCRGRETIDESSSQWTADSCRMESKSGGGKSRMVTRCDRGNGEYEESVIETVAGATTFKTTATSTTVAGGQKNTLVSTTSGRRIGPCKE